MGRVPFTWNIVTEPLIFSLRSIGTVHFIAKRLLEMRDDRHDGRAFPAAVSTKQTINSTDGVKHRSATRYIVRESDYVYARNSFLFTTPQIRLKTFVRYRAVAYRFATR